jgi:hypothetical protein
MIFPINYIIWEGFMFGVNLRHVFILLNAIFLSVFFPSAQVYAEPMIYAQASKEEYKGPQSDPLDPVPARTRALKLKETRGDQPVDSGTLFNPAISIILDGVYANFSQERDNPAGFGVDHSHSEDDDHGHRVEEGFQLREAELSLSGSVDPYFDMLATAALTSSDIELEEAYVTTRALPHGFQLKAGKFYSDIGYINKQHIHDWLFVDRTWMEEFIFGEEGLNEVGLQVSWVAPTSTYIRLGAEVLEGSSEGVANFIGSGDHESITILPGDDNLPQLISYEADKGFDDSAGPRLFTGFAKIAPNLGYNHALQLGVFGGYAREYQMEEIHSSLRLETWDGEAWFSGVDAVYKYDGGGKIGHGNFVLQGEYVFRELNLNYKSREFIDFDTLALTGPAGDPDIRDQKWQQDSLYVQAVYGFLPRWNMGARFDAVGLTNKIFDEERDDEGRRGSTRESLDASFRYTGQVTYAPTEFSRLRMQLARNDIRGGHNSWDLLLQCNISLGVHGVHAF